MSDTSKQAPELLGDLVEAFAREAAAVLPHELMGTDEGLAFVLAALELTMGAAHTLAASGRSDLGRVDSRARELVRAVVDDVPELSARMLHASVGNSRAELKEEGLAYWHERLKTGAGPYKHATAEGRLALRGIDRDVWLSPWRDTLFGCLRTDEGAVHYVRGDVVARLRSELERVERQVTTSSVPDDVGNSRAEQLDEFRRANVERCVGSFKHSLEDWTPLEWAGAFCGEAGELANAVKKLQRGDGELEDVADEIGDVMAYLDLLAARFGIGIWEATAKKWNRVSRARLWPVQLPLKGGA